MIKVVITIKRGFPVNCHTVGMVPIIQLIVRKREGLILSSLLSLPNNVWRLIVFAPFLIFIFIFIIIILILSFREV